MALGVVALGLAGCGGSAVPLNPGEPGNTINYGSFGTTAKIDCADGKYLNVGGSNNTLTVTGSCVAVNVGGADNKITLDRIEQHLAVLGLNNTVVYGGGDPRIDDQGSGNDIRKG